MNRKPDKTTVLLSDGNFSEQGFLIKRIELKLYIEKLDEKLGPYSLITVNIETDKGTIEMIYDEGFRGENALEKATEFVTNNLGISSLVLRSIVSLKEELKKSN
ncbi:MAG: hypothetical protein IH780_03945 [Thaumarchaeota archaeon]|nr:hypothetical protein [Nitrososphaerota archaeon]